MDYPWRSEPFSHQREWWEKTKDKPHWGILWEQGTGKSKLTIDTIAYLAIQGRIGGALVMAPNGVHRNWVVNELPRHLPEKVLKHTKVLFWDTSKANNKSFQKEVKDLLAFPGLTVVAMSYHGIMTEAGDAFAKEFLTSRLSIMILDESARIKNPGAQWTKRVLARGKNADYRRILTGTPVTNSPFDVFAQFKFLCPEIWDAIGCSSFFAFKNHFGIFIDKRDPKSGRTYRDLVKYKNLEQLSEIVAQHSCRVLKQDVLDLPEKLYQTQYFEISEEQKRLYKQMKETFELQLDSAEVTAMQVIVQLIRFQQIVSGFVQTDDGSVHHLETNPRLALFREIVEEAPQKFIVFAKWTEDINLIMKALKEDGVEAVRYDGQTSEADRAEAIVRFQTGTARAFVANPAAAAEGLTLHAASMVIYYNNSYKLSDRLQSEDRAHRIGQRNAVTYVDLVATGTIDEKIVQALRDKVDLASVITRDKVKEWI